MLYPVGSPVLHNRNRNPIRIADCQNRSIGNVSVWAGRTIKRQPNELYKPAVEYCLDSDRRTRTRNSAPYYRAVFLYYHNRYTVRDAACQTGKTGTAAVLPDNQLTGQGRPVLLHQPRAEHQPRIP